MLCKIVKIYGLSAVHDIKGCGQKLNASVAVSRFSHVCRLNASVAVSRFSHVCRLNASVAVSRFSHVCQLMIRVIMRGLSRPPGIYLTAEENSEKPHLGDRLMKSMRIVIASNGVLYLKMTSEESQITFGRKKEEKKGRMGRVTLV